MELAEANSWYGGLIVLGMTPKSGDCGIGPIT